MFDKFKKQEPDICEPDKSSVVTSIGLRYECGVHIVMGRDLTESAVNGLNQEFSAYQRQIGESERGRRVCADGTIRPVTPSIDLKPVDHKFLIPVSRELLELSGGMERDDVAIPAGRQLK